MGYCIETPVGKLWRVLADGERTWLLECPGCGVRGRLDDDQLHGRISVDHDSMGCAGHYHQTHDFAAAIIAAGGEL